MQAGFELVVLVVEAAVFLVPKKLFPKGSGCWDMNTSLYAWAGETLASGISTRPIRRDAPLGAKLAREPSEFNHGSGVPHRSGGLSLSTSASSGGDS
jgi:hypothetical protein